MSAPSPGGNRVIFRTFSIQNCLSNRQLQSSGTEPANAITAQCSRATAISPLKHRRKGLGGAHQTLTSWGSAAVPGSGRARRWGGALPRLETQNSNNRYHLSPRSVRASTAHEPTSDCVAPARSQICRWHPGRQTPSSLLRALLTAVKQLSKPLAPAYRCLLVGMRLWVSSRSVQDALTRACSPATWEVFQPADD